MNPVGKQNSKLPTQEIWDAEKGPLANFKVPPYHPLILKNLMPIGIVCMSTLIIIKSFLDNIVMHGSAKWFLNFAVGI